MSDSLWELYKQHQGKVSDKWTGYLDRYEDLFVPHKDKPISLLEIGVQNGGSIEIWAKYFSKAERIVGIDINPKCGELRFNDPRVQIIVGDATQCEVQSVVTGEFDIIIDDGSHSDADIIKGFSTLFKRLKTGGIYVVEDALCCQDSNPINGVSYFCEIARQLTHNRRVALEGVFSVEFVNCLVIVHKRLPENCGLGTRFIAGQTEEVVGGHRPLHGSLYRE